MFWENPKRKLSYHVSDKYHKYFEKIWSKIKKITTGRFEENPEKYGKNYIIFAR